MKVLCDIDVSIADACHRAYLVERANPDWETFLKPELVILDKPVPGAQRGIEFLRNIADDFIFLTGRNEGLRECTKEWLKVHFNFKATKKNLLMRPVGNMLKPTEYKVNQIIKMLRKHEGCGNYCCDTSHKWLAIDDDKFMMEKYHELGMITLHAPECWKYMFPKFDNLPEEGYWRR